MDFSFSEDQLMVRDLARGILEKEVSPERIKAVEQSGQWFDRPLWATLAQAGLLGLAVEEEYGGMGFGFAELCVLLAEVGRAVAPVPVLPALALGGLAIARFGSEEQKRRWLAPLAAGEVLLTAALGEGTAAFADTPATTARKQGAAWVLDGSKCAVPCADLAARIVVPASTEAGVALFLVDPQAAGVTIVAAESTTGESSCEVVLSGVSLDESERLGGAVTATISDASDGSSSGAAASGNGESRARRDLPEGASQLAWLRDRALVAVAAMQVGVSEKALEITARYVSEREQFGVPIGSFQAVQHRCADCYIDIEATRWVTWRAAWKLARGKPALRESAVAKFWAAEASYRIANSAQHLHGGIGVDLDYPLHRYFLWAKSLELFLGGATAQLVRLGSDMARNPAQESL